MGLQANRILFAVAELVIGWLLVRQSVVAHEKRAQATGADRDFYAGKIAGARFYCANVLPGITLARKLVESSTLDVMEVPEEAFG